jgi:hypothetical protein
VGQCRTAVAAIAIAATVLSACAGGQKSPARRAAEQRYVEGVHEQATDIRQYLNDSKLVRLGNAVCDGFRARGGIEQIADLMERTNGRNLSPGDLGAIISNSVKNLCPAYRGRLATTAPPA